VSAPKLQAEFTKSEESRHLEIDATRAAAIADLLRLQAIRAGLIASSVAQTPAPGDNDVIDAVLARVSRAVDVMEGAA
jgi:hypothetical protein